MPERADVVVVGLGVGGEEVAGRLARAGLSVVGIEERLVGGECPYWGCVPSKMMIRAANLLAEARRVNAMAGRAEVHPDWAPVARRIRDEATDNWNDAVAVRRLVDKGGRFVRGRARLVAPGRVAVGADEFEADRAIVLGVGTAPAAPPIPGLASAPYWTNREAIEAADLPESLAVLGAGAVGLELAQVFARFGVPVTIVEAAPRALMAEEPEASRLAARALAADGVALHTGARVAQVSHANDRFRLSLAGAEAVSAERLLVATGRRAELAELGVASIGLDPTANAIEVDGRMRAAPGVWAVGDVTGRGAFTHVAMYQADICVRDILGEDPPPADYRALPRVTFTDPEIGAVGLTESRAREQGLSVRIGLASLPSAARGWIHQAGNDGFVKLVADADRDILVGATTAGPAGGEVLYGLAVAIHGEVPLARLRHMIYAYPTFHRAVEDALRDLG